MTPVLELIEIEPLALGSGKLGTPCARMHSEYLSSLAPPPPPRTAVAAAPPEPPPLDELKLGPPLVLVTDCLCEFADELRCATEGLLEPQAASASAIAIGSASFLALEKVGMRQ